MALDMAGDELDDCPASSVMSLDIGRESRNANGNLKKCQYLTFLTSFGSLEVNDTLCVSIIVKSSDDTFA